MYWVIYSQKASALRQKTPRTRKRHWFRAEFLLNITSKVVMVAGAGRS
jgi:hypothetical protein